MSFIDLFYIFAIYSFLGWLIENIFSKIKKYKSHKNHFLKGPFTPIYGFGAILIIFLALPFYPNLPLFFLTSVFVTSILEYFSSLFFDKFFHTRWWNYSKEFPNIDGRISLKHSIYWGILSTIVFLPSFPYLLILSKTLSQTLGIFGIIVFLVYITIESVNFLKNSKKHKKII